MQFQVPQFIDVEDKIFGPLTLKQFLYLCGAGAISFMLFFSLTTPLWIGISVVLLALACVLAFIRINGQSMPRMLLASFGYLWFPKFYVWRYTTPGQALPVVHDLPRAQGEEGSPLKKLFLRFNTARGPISGQ